MIAVMPPASRIYIAMLARIAMRQQVRQTGCLAFGLMIASNQPLLRATGLRVSAFENMMHPIKKCVGGAKKMGTQFMADGACRWPHMGQSVSSSDFITIKIRVFRGYAKILCIFWLGLPLLCLFTRLEWLGLHGVSLGLRRWLCPEFLLNPAMCRRTVLRWDTMLPTMR